MGFPADFLQTEIASLDRTYAPFAAFAALTPKQLPVDPAVPQIPEDGQSSSETLPALQPQQQQQENRFLCAVRHPRGSLLLDISLETQGLKLLHLVCFPEKTPQAAVKEAKQQQQGILQQEDQQQLESWGVPTSRPYDLFESFEGLLQAVCPKEFQRIHQELLLQGLKQKTTG